MGIDNESLRILGRIRAVTAPWRVFETLSPSLSLYVVVFIWEFWHETFLILDGRNDGKKGEARPRYRERDRKMEVEKSAEKRSEEKNC